MKSMQIILIGNRETSDDPETYYGEYKQFFSTASAYSKNKPEIKFTLFEDLIISVGDDTFSIYDTRHQSDIKMYDAVLIRGKGFRNYFDVIKTISTYAKHHKVPVINDYSGFRDSSKLMQATQFFELGIPVAKTIFVTKAVLESNKLELDFPCIMKAAFGAHGNDNYLIHSLEEAQKIAADNSDKQFVLQRFVPNDNDYRLLVIGEEVFAFGRAAAKGSHLNNTSQGGTAALIPLEQIPSKVIEDAKRITSHLQMTFSGVDVLSDKNTGEFYFLEVNSQPQLMSGAFIDLKAQAIGKFFDKL